MDPTSAKPAGCGSACACSTTKVPVTAEPRVGLTMKSATIVGLAGGAWLLGALTDLGGYPSFAKASYAASLLTGLYPVLKRLRDNLREGYYLTIETLMIIACVGAIFLQAYSEAAAVVTLFAVGEIMEKLASHKANASIAALRKLQPETARLITNDSEITVPVGNVNVGDHVRVIAGDRIPLDALVFVGEASVDESLITGESEPKFRGESEIVLAGSLLLDGSLTLRVTASADESTVARIQRLVQEAEKHRSHTERLVTKFSRYYTPGIVVVAAFIAALPVFGVQGEFRTWLYRALSLLLIGCPCALVLSTPTAVTAALAVGARIGVLIKGGLAIESFAMVKNVAFDKTGTITTGRPSLVSVNPAAGVSESSLLTLAASIEKTSNHPIARTLIEEAAKRSLPLESVSNPRILPGRGIAAELGGRRVSVIAFRKKDGDTPIPNDLESKCEAIAAAAATPIMVTENGVPMGILGFADTVRPEAADVIAQLNALGVRSLILTGDSHASAKGVADSLGVEFHSELLPEDKEMLIETLEQQGPTAMIGDGINDAPAMARATVSLAMGGGTQVALDSSDAALVGDNLWGVLNLARLAQLTRRNIIQNISIAMGLKALFLIGSIGGFVTLWMAVFADTGATVLVTLNALRILRFRSVNGESR